MLTQYDIDTLMQKIQNNEPAYIYYIAHMVEMRESLLEEYSYKSNSDFIVVRLRVNNISNAYFEYLNYLANPNNYHEESETVYYDRQTEHTNFYTVSNDSVTGNDKFFNSRMPSIIYGRRRRIYDMIEHKEKEISDDSPVKVLYANTLEYGDISGDNALVLYNNGNLDWKYRKLKNPANVDGIDYNYITSNWYILDIKNFPRTEKPLIKINELNAYFTDINLAFNYMEQLLA